MKYDALISQTARGFLNSLGAEDQAILRSALNRLLDNPAPDGLTKIALPAMPYREGTLGYTSGSFWIVYRVMNAATIYISAIHWSLDSPNHPMNRDVSH